MSWEAELEELKYRHHLAEQMGGPEGIERQHGRGKLTVRERIAELSDPGSFQEIGKLEAEIIARGKGLRGLARLLQIHGLNLIAAIGLLVEIGDIEQFKTSKQLVAYAGLATSVRQSNQTDRRGKITKQGRKRLRTICIRAVLTMVNRTKTPLMEFYAEKKRAKGAGKAICATARKLLVIVFVMLKKELDYWYVEDRLYNQKLKALRACA